MQKLQQFDRRALATLNWLVKEVRTLKETTARRFHGFVYPDTGKVMVVKFLVNEPTGVAYDDEGFNIDNVSIMQPDGATEYPGGSAPTAVKNILGVPADNNTPGIAWYNQATQLWEGIPQLKLDECSCDAGSGS